jgi:copper homeostasis protein CutC
MCVEACSSLVLGGVSSNLLLSSLIIVSTVRALSLIRASSGERVFTKDYCLSNIAAVA